MVHLCEHPGCGAYACYGMGASLREGRPGRWWCPGHAPAEFWASIRPVPAAEAPAALPRQGSLL